VPRLNSLSFRSGLPQEGFPNNTIGLLESSAELESCSKMLELAKGEQAHRQAVQKRATRLDWAALQEALAELKGEPWEVFAQRRANRGW
jgi:hypothetical protein